MGRFYNPYLKDGESFLSLSQFLVKMDLLLDSMKLPQPYTATRTFAAPPEERQAVHAAPEHRAGALATFAVRVIFRQNSSWQGSVTWVDQGREESFRSVLELILLMDSALQSSGTASE